VTEFTYGQMFKELEKQCTCPEKGEIPTTNEELARACPFCFYKKGLMLSQEKEELGITELIPTKYLMF